MFTTPDGVRILEGASRKLFEASLGMIADMHADADYGSGVAVFEVGAMMSSQNSRRVLVRL